MAENGIKKNAYDESGVVRSIRLYLVLMTIGMALSSLTGYSSVVLWMCNLVALALAVGKYCFWSQTSIWFVAFVYLTVSAISVLMNTSLITTDLKTIGTHINIVITPLYLIMLSNLYNRFYIGKNGIRKILSCLSLLGCVAVIFSWVFGFADYIGVFQGTVGVYRAEIAGFFNSKNLYGAFVALSFCADLYLLKTEGKNKKYLLLLILKGIAVVVSYSRAALLQCVVALILFFWFERRRSVKEWVLLVLVAGSFFIAYQMLPDVQYFIDNTVLRLDVGDAGRALLRDSALSMVVESSDSLFFGVGFAGVSELNIDIDNTYYYKFFSGGLVGFLLFLGLLIASFVLICRMPKAQKDLKGICMAVFMSYLIYMSYESIAPLELGILNFTFMLFIFVIPCAVTPLREERVRMTTTQAEDE